MPLPRNAPLDIECELFELALGEGISEAPTRAVAQTLEVAGGRPRMRAMARPMRVPRRAAFPIGGLVGSVTHKKLPMIGTRCRRARLQRSHQPLLLTLVEHIAQAARTQHDRVGTGVAVRVNCGAVKHDGAQLFIRQPPHLSSVREPAAALNHAVLCRMNASTS